jgi:hypothetical protein
MEYGESKIEKIRYGIKRDECDTYNNEENGDLERGNVTEGGIVKGVLNLNDLIDEPQADKEIPTIEQYYTDIKLKEQAVIEEELIKREEEKKIEEPVDLTYAESNYYYPVKERRVSYKRTFGITDSRKRDLDRIITIGLFALCGILGVISFILSH